MAPASLLDLVSALPSTDAWGPAVSTETTLDGVPYAPYSKADKLGRMADWTEGKDRERGGRQQYGGRNYRGSIMSKSFSFTIITDQMQTSKYTAQTNKTTHLP
jgi:hypothetical protein